MLSREHLVAIRLNSCFPCQGKKCAQDRLGNQVLGVVQEEGRARIGSVNILDGERGKAVGILSEQVLEHEPGMLAVVDLLELLVSRVL